MKNYFQFNKKTFFIFFGLGTAVTVATFLVRGFEEFDAFLSTFIQYSRHPIIHKFISTFLVLLPLYIVGIIFILDFLKKNFIRCLSFFAGFVLVYVILLGLLLLPPLIHDYANRIPFDSATWKNVSAKEDWDNPVRERMVDDLLKHHQLVGMRRDQINELLGNPLDKTRQQIDVSSSSSVPLVDRTTYTYWLGPERSLISIDSEMLNVEFKDDIVVKAYIWND